jgi:hypothetical protein
VRNREGCALSFSLHNSYSTGTIIVLMKYEPEEAYRSVQLSKTSA